MVFTKQEQELQNNKQKQNKTEQKGLILHESAYLFGSKYSHGKRF